MAGLNFDKEEQDEIVQIFLDMQGVAPTKPRATPARRIEARINEAVENVKARKQTSKVNKKERDKFAQIFLDIQGVAPAKPRVTPARKIESRINQAIENAKARRQASKENLDERTRRAGVPAPVGAAAVGVISRFLPTVGRFLTPAALVGIPAAMIASQIANASSALEARIRARGLLAAPPKVKLRDIYRDFAGGKGRAAFGGMQMFASQGLNELGAVVTMIGTLTGSFIKGDDKEQAFSEARQTFWKNLQRPSPDARDSLEIMRDRFGQQMRRGFFTASGTYGSWKTPGLNGG